MGWKLEAVSIPASDMDRAKTFYAEKVEFNVDLGVNADGDPRGAFVLLIDLYTALAPV